MRVGNNHIFETKYDEYHNSVDMYFYSFNDNSNNNF